VYKRKDFFYLRAKEEGYNSRAAYKLKEIVTASRLIKAGDRILDIGCAPGGWLQVALGLAGKKGLVVGVDIEKIKGLSAGNLAFVQGDILNKDVQLRVRSLLNDRADVLLSDASPNLTGIRERDHRMSFDLVKSILTLTKEFLKENGNFLVKVIEGPDTKDLFESVKSCFDFTKITRPDSTRSRSRENYIVATGFNAL